VLVTIRGLVSVCTYERVLHVYTPTEKERGDTSTEIMKYKTTRLIGVKPGEN